MAAKIVTTTADQMAVTLPYAAKPSTTSPVTLFAALPNAGLFILQLLLWSFPLEHATIFFKMDFGWALFVFYFWGVLRQKEG
jgi:hypothetical protein